MKLLIRCEVNGIPTLQNLLHLLYHLPSVCTCRHMSYKYIWIVYRTVCMYLEQIGLYNICMYHNELDVSTEKRTWRTLSRNTDMERRAICMRVEIFGNLRTCINVSFATGRVGSRQRTRIGTPPSREGLPFHRPLLDDKKPWSEENSVLSLSPDARR